VCALLITACLFQSSAALALGFAFLCPGKPGPQPPAQQIRKAIEELNDAVKRREEIEEEDARRQVAQQPNSAGQGDVAVAVKEKAWDPNDPLASIRLELCNLNLQGQDLSRLDFTDFRIDNVDFSKANLDGAIFNDRQGAQGRMEFSGASLRGARFSFSSLAGTHFNSADLTDAQFFMTDLRDAYLLDTTVANAIFDATISGATYAPKGPLPHPLSRFYGLEDVRYPFGGQSGVVQLRDFYQKNGRREDERRATHAIERNNTSHMFLRSVGGTIEGAFRWLVFDMTTGYGLYPGRALWLILVLFVLFTPYYVSVIEKSLDGGKIDGIYLVLPNDRIVQKHGAPMVGKRAKVSRLSRQGKRAWRWGAYFSLLSAFHVGFREFNVGSWIARTQKRRYYLEAIGRARTVSGVQSLLSLILLALWLLTYFGRPFQ